MKDQEEQNSIVMHFAVNAGCCVGALYACFMHAIGSSGGSMQDKKVGKIKMNE